MDQDIFLNSFVIMYKCTTNSKLLDFQYRLLHNCLVTNTKLKQWAIQTNELCTFCNAQPETTYHLLLHCQYSQNIWNQLFAYIAQHGNIFVTLDNNERILGVRGNSLSAFYNVICILTKQYIYACRCKNILPNFFALIEKIRFEKYVEKTIAIKHGKITEWEKKWELLSHLEYL